MVFKVSSLIHVHRAFKINFCTNLTTINFDQKLNVIKYKNS